MSGTRTTAELDLFHIQRVRQRRNVISWSSSNGARSGNDHPQRGRERLKPAEDFIAEYQRLLVLYRAAFQKRQQQGKAE